MVAGGKSVMIRAREADENDKRHAGAGSSGRAAGPGLAPPTKGSSATSESALLVDPRPDPSESVGPRSFSCHRRRVHTPG
jgi:hypothetical protein